MALGFNSNLFNTPAGNSVLASNTNNDVEAAGVLADTNVETAGALANASGSCVDSFESNNPFAPQIDYSQFASVPETAGSLADAGVETAGSLAFGVETAGSLACGAETAGSVASGDSGSSFGSFDSGIVC